MTNDLLTVVYDLRVLPNTYDFSTFLAIAEARRLILEPSKRLRLIIVVGARLRPRSWDWADGLSETDIAEEFDARLCRIIFPIAGLLPSVADMQVLNHELISDIPDVFHPINYDFKQPALGVYHKTHYCMDYADKTDMRYIRNSRHALRLAKEYLNAKTGHENPAIFTLRNNFYSPDPTRNTRDETNKRLYQVLLDKGIPFAVIPDTSLSDLSLFPKALNVLTTPAFDLRLRSAIYEAARFCIFDPTGPVGLGWFNRHCTFIAHGMAISSYYSEDFHLNRGYKKNQNIISKENPKQLWLWDNLGVHFFSEWLKFIGEV